MAGNWTKFLQKIAWLLTARKYMVSTVGSMIVQLGLSGLGLSGRGLPGRGLLGLP